MVFIKKINTDCHISVVMKTFVNLIVCVQSGLKATSAES